MRELAPAPDKLTVGNSDTRWDYSHPVYYSSPGDPEFTLHCYESSWAAARSRGTASAFPTALVPPAARTRT